MAKTIQRPTRRIPKRNTVAGKGVTLPRRQNGVVSSIQERAVCAADGCLRVPRSFFLPFAGYCSPACAYFHEIGFRVAPDPDPNVPMPPCAPLEYRPTMFVEGLHAYLSLCDEFSLPPQLLHTKMSHSMARFFMRGAVLPSVRRFAEFLGFSKAALYLWADQGKADVEAALEAIKDAQHECLMSGGLAGWYEAPIVKLNLMTNHGYREAKTEDVRVGLFSALQKAYRDVEAIDRETEPGLVPAAPAGLLEPQIAKADERDG